MTEENEEQPAQMIELHDAGVILRSSECEEGYIGWREYAGLGGAKWRIDGKDIARLAEAFGKTLGTYSEESETGIEKKRVADEEFNIRRSYLDVGDGSTDYEYEDSHVIEKIWAREDNGVLHIRTLCSYTVNIDGGSVKRYEQRLTYRGSYTIWWSAEEAADDVFDAE